MTLSCGNVFFVFGIIRKFATKEGRGIAAALCRISGRTKKEGLSKLFYFATRYRKVTTWARVQMLLGEKRSALTPAVTPFSTAQATALT